eukprot:CAMPEP_0177722680 /NCGR_PEP_ID=MMETSP0484_2-20121128/17812_1 /TAXON_ID=354590 /ORGANISM="Rhodomonas lens, Strain RHODO" /LENGTH=51 /DNA_ID=CAMNT_0019235073 /DNA_START=64 /DNA_END=216 /DNA_ORIENTATION=+
MILLTFLTVFAIRSCRSSILSTLFISVCIAAHIAARGSCSCCSLRARVRPR